MSQNELPETTVPILQTLLCLRIRENTHMQAYNVSTSLPVKYPKLHLVFYGVVQTVPFSYTLTNRMVRGTLCTLFRSSCIETVRVVFSRFAK